MNFKKVSYFETTDYSIFNLLPFNRDVDQAHVRSLVESMAKNGFKGVVQIIETSFIDGENKLYILDGQHRVAAAKLADLPVRFELTKCETKRETVELISEMNNSSKSWGTNIFLNVWKGLGIEEYVMLSKVKNETGFQITPLIEVFTGESKMKAFRKGTMTFPNIKESQKIIDQLLELNKFLPKKAFCRRAVIRVMRLAEYNHKIMVKQVKSYVEITGAFNEKETELRSELIKLMKQGNKKAA